MNYRLPSQSLPSFGSTIMNYGCFFLFFLVASSLSDPASAFVVVVKPTLNLQNIFPSRNPLLHYSKSNDLLEENEDSLDKDNFRSRGDSSMLSSRRDMMVSSGMALASFLLWNGSEAAVAMEDQAPTSTYVLTGSNSGIGFDAALRLAQRGGESTIVLACRTLGKAQDAVDRIKTQLDGSNSSINLVPAECDLASLESIDKFCTNTLGNMNVDVLCCNAGIARNTAAKDVLRTKEGFEATVGINHFGHFYLTNKLLSKIKRRIVITASSVHDPDSPGGAQGEKATLGSLRGLIEQGRNFEMVDGEPFNADKAYKDSKLCNVLFTRELQRRLDDAKSPVTANCFSPGLIVSTGLFRDQNPFFTKVFDFAATDLLKVGETISWGGGCLDYMITSGDISKGGQFFTSPPGSSKYGEKAYGKEFSASDVSKEAHDDAKAKKLWEISEKLLNLA